MKNWRTTIAGIALSLYPIIDSLIQAYQAGYFTDKTGSQLWLGIGFIIFGVLAKDHNVSGSKEKAKLFTDTPIDGGGDPNDPKKKP